MKLENSPIGSLLYADPAFAGVYLLVGISPRRAASEV